MDNATFVLNQMQWGMRVLFSPIMRIFGFDIVTNGVDNTGSSLGRDADGATGREGGAGYYRQGGAFRPLSKLSFSSSGGDVPELELVDSSAKNDENNEACSSTCEKVHGAVDGTTFEQSNWSSKGGEGRQSQIASAKTAASSLGSTENNGSSGNNLIQGKVVGIGDRRPIRYDMEGLEPTFLTEEEYPPGWLVYHPVHGVITREKALEWDGKKDE